MPGCDAATLCTDFCAVCGNPAAGDCCEDNGTPGCSDEACCAAVCADDEFCCDIAWDEGCATTGFQESGFGAQKLCRDLCGCPNTCGDINGGGSNDLKDFAFLANCFGLSPDASQECACSDLNGDGFIDLADYKIFKNLLGSSSVEFPPNCPP